MIKEVNPDQSLLTLKAYEALAKVADGQSTKIIIPLIFKEWQDLHLA